MHNAVGGWHVYIFILFNALMEYHDEDIDSSSLIGDTMRCGVGEVIEREWREPYI